MSDRQPGLGGPLSTAHRVSIPSMFSVKQANEQIKKKSDTFSCHFHENARKEGRKKKRERDINVSNITYIPLHVFIKKTRVFFSFSFLMGVDFFFPRRGGTS